MPRAPGEGRRVVLLGGEPGSGKSRLVREFAGEAAADGALVLHGACDAVVRTPYGPFVEALDHLARSVDPAELRAAPARRRRAHAPAPGPRRPRSASCRPPAAPTRTPSATGSTPRSPTSCAASAARRPVLLVLEDAHWADAPTLLLLRHLARTAGDARLLLLATFRDTEADMPQALADALADLRRSEDVVRLRLDRALRRRGGRASCAAPRTAAPGPPELAARDPRAHRRQRVPGLRAVARAGRDRRSCGSPTARSR